MIPYVVYFLCGHPQKCNQKQGKKALAFNENFRAMALTLRKCLYEQPWANVGHRTQIVFTCSKLTAETPEKGMKYVQS